MRVALPIVAIVTACSGAPPGEPAHVETAAYALRGVIVDLRPPDAIVVDHEEIAGFMPPMVMPITLADPAALGSLAKGDRIEGVLRVDAVHSKLADVRVVSHAEPPRANAARAPLVLTTEVFPPTEIQVTGGETWTIGAGQPKATLLTFLYTTCPLPELCPATLRRLQELQALAGDDVRLLAVTIDPVREPLSLLERFATDIGARPERWRFGRVDGEALVTLAQRAGIEVWGGDSATLEHSTRWLVIGRDGVVIERYFDNRFEAARVVRQLQTGRPRHDEERAAQQFPMGGAR